MTTKRWIGLALALALALPAGLLAQEEGGETDD